MKVGAVCPGLPGIWIVEEDEKSILRSARVHKPESVGEEGVAGWKHIANGRFSGA